MSLFDRDKNSDAPGSQELDLDAVDAYDYDLPDELIAAHPADRRSESRLLIARREHADGDGGELIEHRRFSELTNFLRADDLLVFNNTRVIPARIMARKETGGAVEMLVLDIVEPSGDERWTQAGGEKVVFRCMTRSSRPLRPGMALDLEGGGVGPFVVREWEAGKALVEVSWAGSALELVEAVGQMPLPPYILKRRKMMGEAEEATAEDLRRYQTVYAQKPGAVAAPTAGLHFSEELFESLDQIGVRRAFVTLQVGIGTFQPVSADRLSEHEMHSEEYEVSAELAGAIAETRQAGGRVIAVGTTSARALEAEARREAPFEPGVRRTDIFLHPGVDFQVCDGLITNFHLPRSTLLALVAGFAGYDLMRRIYKEALEERYRFYSYGDGMLIL